jgi:rhamnose utilization protein RhaD (predicted bifunctional aldolase and dehydrogenase)/NAD(P)-dependent dehydrogenase (short-subunit alcohol dehydrogenase family)
MKNKWSDVEASKYLDLYAKQWGKDLALRTYSSRLIGAEKNLVLHGGGNTSVKSLFTAITGDRLPVIYVKASGYDLAGILPESHIALDLEYLKKLRILPRMADEAMMNECMVHRFKANSAAPSLETLSHVFIPYKYIDHTHADSILALSNQQNGDELIREALGDDLIVLEYRKPGFALAKAVAESVEVSPLSGGMVLMKHGLFTWGDSAKISYKKTVELVTKAEKYIAKLSGKPLRVLFTTSIKETKKKYLKTVPILRGNLAIPTRNSDLPYQRFILKPLITEEALHFINSAAGRDLALTAPITSDHLIRTKAVPLWINDLKFNEEEKLRQQISQGINKYITEYKEYFRRNSKRLKSRLSSFDPRPRIVIIPGAGVFCAGRDVNEAEIARDITAQTIAVKTQAAAIGKYEGLNEQQLFDMEYCSIQHAKLDHDDNNFPLRHSVAIITGAAGAIGSGICQLLLENRCHVAATDLPGKNLELLEKEYKPVYGKHLMTVPLDVTDPGSVAESFASVIETWGGIDLVIINAGIAHVSPLSELHPDDFRKLEKVNVEGTLHILSESSRFFKKQGTGGDIVVISTKNVFAPGAKFGAYSATKAAAHQLARIASLELADIGVRVNMVSPDAVFTHGKYRSGLWAKVGPDRMKARGLDEKGLEEYYKNRNLLKTKITAAHVAKAVLFFATRQTPTTGATIPVDGGLPDSTPR